MGMEPWKRSRNIISAPLQEEGGGGGVIPLYKLYRHVPPHRVGFLCRFGLKTGIHFAPPPLPSSPGRLTKYLTSNIQYVIGQIKIPLFHSIRAQNEEPTR